MKWHPASEEHESGYAGNDEKIQIFSKIEETEMNT